MNTKAISRLILVGVASICAALPAAAQSSVKADANAITVTGQVTCSRMIGPLFATKGMSAAQRVTYCANQGSNYYALVAGNRVFRLTGDRKLLGKLAAKTVTVAGVLSPASSDVATYALVDTVQITNVVSTKN